MLLQEPAQRPLQLAGAVAVNEPHGALIGQQRFVEEPLRARDRLVHACSRSRSDPTAVASRGCSSTLTLTRAVRRRSAGADRRRAGRARWRACACRARRPPPRRREGSSRRLRGRRPPTITRSPTLGSRPFVAGFADRRGGRLQQTCDNPIDGRPRVAARGSRVARRDRMPSRLLRDRRRSSPSAPR